jgi:UDP-N-acetylmuramate dehydrogenase
MQIQENFSLLKYNSFKINVSCAYFISISNITDLISAIHFANEKKVPFLIIGGGSNILFTSFYNGVIIHNNILGIRVFEEDENTVSVNVSAGENWHALVQYCLQKNWFGIENLSLIPGNVGAAPIQNIGAYGVEVKDTIASVEYLDLDTKSVKKLSNINCNFGYRNSIFKTTLKGKAIITAVNFLLQKKATLQVQYGAISQVLEAEKITLPSPIDIANAVIKIRQSKLPNPAELGNAGSFFKNPIVSKFRVHVLLEQYPEMPLFKGNSEENYKLSAAWLIEKCNFKGFKKGNVGCYHLQPLVLVNFGQANGNEIIELANTIIQAVNDKFGIGLEAEVNII